MPYLLLGAALISFAGVFVKLVDAGPTAAAFYRMLFGGLVLLAFVLVRGERLRPAGRPLAFMLLAAALFALDLFFYHRSIHFVGPGLATLVANMQVLALAFVGVAVFGERLRWQTALSIPIAVLGLATIVGFEWLSLARTASMYAAYAHAVTSPYAMPKR